MNIDAIFTDLDAHTLDPKRPRAQKIGVFAGNHEFSPSQYEINIWHGEALEACDRIFMLKAGVKDLIARLGQAATFAGKPWGDEGGSGETPAAAAPAAEPATPIEQAPAAQQPVVDPPAAQQSQPTAETPGTGS